MGKKYVYIWNDWKPNFVAPLPGNVYYSNSFFTIAMIRKAAQHNIGKCSGQYNNKSSFIKPNVKQAKLITCAKISLRQSVDS